MSQANRDRLEAHLRNAETLGGTAKRLTGSSVARSLLEDARHHQRHQTDRRQGEPTPRLAMHRLTGSLLDEIVRGSGDIEVHVIGGDGPSSAPPRKLEPAPARAPLRHYVAATLLVAVTLGLSAVLHWGLRLPDLEMLFLLTVMVTAVWFGRGPSALAAALSRSVL